MHTPLDSGTLLLTSAAFLNPKIKTVVKNLVPTDNAAVAIITTAASGKESHRFSQLAQKQFLAMGYKKVDFIDLECQPLTSFSAYKILYVCGGNPFKLLYHAQKTGFEGLVKSFLLSGGLYIGVSAGSVITAPTIQIAKELAPDPNDVGLTDFKSLSITDIVVYPHYEPYHEEVVRAFELKHDLEVVRLTDLQALRIDKHGCEVLE